MNWAALFAEIAKLFAPLPAADTSALRAALTDLQTLAPSAPTQPGLWKETVMSGPTGFVQLLQSDLDTFATEFEAVKTALATYIAQLVANQSTPLPAADESGLNKALADLTALEPPSGP
jgi:hypothetical protein